MVERLNKANVSAIAAIIALKHNLLPGFCFLVDEDEDGYRTITSSGTNLPTRYGGGRQIAGLREKAVYAGESWLAGQRVLWFQLATQEQFTLREDPRTTSQLLRDAIARHVADDRVRAFNRINGIVGGMLSKDRAQNEAQAMAMLSHRFEDDSEFFDISEILISTCTFEEKLLSVLREEARDYLATSLAPMSITISRQPLADA